MFDREFRENLARNFRQRGLIPEEPRLIDLWLSPNGFPENPRLMNPGFIFSPWAGLHLNRRFLSTSFPPVELNQRVQADMDTETIDSMEEVMRRYRAEFRSDLAHFPHGRIQDVSREVFAIDVRFLMYVLSGINRVTLQEVDRSNRDQEFPEIDWPPIVQVQISKVPIESPGKSWTASLSTEFTGRRQRSR
jgi:hypothetical protein